MNKLIWWAGALALLSGTGCCRWCDRWCGAQHHAAAPAVGSPCCVPCAPVQPAAQCCPVPAAAPCCPTPVAPVSSTGFARPQQ